MKGAGSESKVISSSGVLKRDIPRIVWVPKFLVTKLTLNSDTRFKKQLHLIPALVITTWTHLDIPAKIFSCAKETQNRNQLCSIVTPPTHTQLKGKKKPGFIYIVVSTECTEDCCIYKSALI